MMNQSAATSQARRRVDDDEIALSTKRVEGASQPQTLFASHLVSIERRSLAVSNRNLELRFELQRHRTQALVSRKHRELAFESVQ